jgi:hypothetical protein
MKEQGRLVFSQFNRTSHEIQKQAKKPEGFIAFIRFDAYPEVACPAEAYVRQVCDALRKYHRLKRGRAQNKRLWLITLLFALDTSFQKLEPDRSEIFP